MVKRMRGIGDIGVRGMKKRGLMDYGWMGVGDGMSGGRIKGEM